MATRDKRIQIDEGTNFFHEQLKNIRTKKNQTKDIKSIKFESIFP
jgi:hypothetical protein